MHDRPTLRSATLWVGALTAAAYVASFLKNVVMAWAFGAGREVDLYVTAMLLPLTVVGVLELILRNNLVPELAEHMRPDSRSELWEEVSRFANVVVLLLGLITVAYLLSLPWTLRWLAPGFVGEEAASALSMAALCAPILVLAGLTSLLGSVLNALFRFRPAAVVPLLGNLVGVVAIVGLHDRWGSRSLAFAAVAAATVQLVALGVAIARQPVGRYVPSANPFHPNVTRFLRRCAPYVVGLVAFRSSLVVDNLLASTLGEGRIAALSYATKLTSPIFVVVTTSVFTVLLSSISHLCSRGEWGEVRRLAARAHVWLGFVVLPLALVLAAVAVPAVTALFARGQFDADSVALTAAPMLWYALALVPQSFVQVYIGVFLAARDTRSVMWADIVAALAHVVLDLLWLRPFGHAGLALSLAMAATVQYAFLAYRFAGRHGALLRRSDWSALARMAIAATAAAVGAALVARAIGGTFGAGFVGSSVVVGAAAALGGAVYLIVNRLTALPTQREAIGWLRQGLRRDPGVRST